MRYTIIKSPITKKHYIWDSEEKKMSSEKGFDIILEIVQDKIAIVGRADFYQSGYYYYSTYKYQLVDVKGRPISEREFDFVYPYDSFIRFVTIVTEDSVFFNFRHPSRKPTSADNQIIK